MSWQYCEKCGHGLDNPTPVEVCRQEQECPACGHSNDPLKSVAELVLELVERIEVLEGHAQ